MLGDADVAVALGVLAEAGGVATGSVGGAIVWDVGAALLGV